MKPIHKFNNGNRATLCHRCSVIITVGATNDLYCDICIKAKEFYEQIEKEVHFNKNNLNK